ncbi:AraC family transcriptional regulator [Fulvivirgaceae bacterium BMA10]|uniref:AraC family transcriptional regulator n=1 Tax=Splendidivirga corallicola TaxID=3051826 RepID=A0ABT8KXJ8_9BACT|nr:AraC family transcriptional regulator [Fulvivirgaceae bacterium BMA10]
MPEKNKQQHHFPSNKNTFKGFSTEESGFMESTDEYQNSAGKTHIRNWYLDGIRLVHTVADYDHLTSQSYTNDNDLIRLHFSLKGNYSFFYEQLERSFALGAGHHNIMYSEGFDITVESEDLQLEMFGIQFTKEAFLNLTQNVNDSLSRFSERIINGQSAILSPSWPLMNPNLSRIINEVLNCRFTGQMKRLFLLSKSIEMLVLQAEAHDQMEGKALSFVKKSADKDKLMAARDFVTKRLNDPPNLSEVAKTVGLNEYKLKRGFKELFHTTVYGYITDHRLDLAYQILLDTDKTASEVAFELGYSSPQHFNNAFKKKYGVPPGSLKK